MFKVCLIGCGGIAEGFHGPALKKYCGDYPDTLLAACCDVDINKAEKFASNFGFGAFYSDYHEMLMNEKPNAVSIASPYSVITSIAVDVINMGYPVMMEKPPGVTGDDVLKIIEAAKKSNVPNQVAFNRRFCPVVDKLKNMLTDYPQGAGIHNLRCVFQRVGRKDPDFFATAIHGIDTLRYLAGCDYKRVNFTYQEQPELNKGAANIYMDCLMESGAVAQLSICPAGGRVIEDYIVTCGDNEFVLNMPVWGALDYPGGLSHFSDNKLVKRVGGSDPVMGEDMLYAFGFYSENASFLNDIKAGRKPANDINTALQSVEIAHCIKTRKLYFTNRR